MKTSGSFFISILFIILFSHCRVSDKDYSSAKDIEIQWELITNFTDIEDVFEARFIMKNNSDMTLEDNWKLFFNINARPIIDPPSPQQGSVEHINGDWFSLTPVKGFELDPGDSIEIIYRGTEGVIKETDGPLGTYFVFYDQKDEEGRIVEVNCEILPFTRPEQINRNKNDKEPIPTPEYRYHNNQGLSLVSVDKLLPLIPSPVSIRKAGGTVTVDEKWSIFHEKGLENEAQYLANRLQEITGNEFGVTDNNTGKKQIRLQAGNIAVNGKNKEAYHLNIQKDNIAITGSDAAGVFYGVQSLIALIPLDAWKNHSKSIEMPLVSIKDAPRFVFRGFHLDIARNFQTKESLKRVLDIISFYKLNKFLLYITEDEGWRLEIPGLPELTQTGAQRQHTKSYRDPVLHPAYGSGPFAYAEGKHGSGYLTRDDFIELLKYAAARHIQIIPEVNLPAHARAAIKSMEARYNKLLAEGKREEANEFRLIDPEDTSKYLSAQMYRDNVTSIARTATYHFYRTVMDEIEKMYKDAGLELIDIHIGGDEVPEHSWDGSPEVMEMVKEKGITDTRNLQAFFVSTLLDTLKDRHYRAHGWEEVALLKSDAGLKINTEFINRNVIPYTWNNLFFGQDIAYRLANRGYKVVMCPVSNFYFDLAYDKDPKEPGLYWAGFVRTRDAWTFAPFDMFKTTLQDAMGRPIDIEKETADLERLKPEARKNILGVQAQLWAETLKGRDMLEYYLLPKLTGFAESAWSKERKWETIEDRRNREKVMDDEWNVFANTIARKDLPRLSYINGGYNHRIPLPGAIIEDGMLKANIEFPGLELRYTTDGNEPTANSTLYEKPVAVSGTVLMRAFDASGKGSRTAVVKL